MQKIITPDLKAIAAGQRATIPADISLVWVEDAKGKPALHIQPKKHEFAVEDEWIVVLTDIVFTNGVIEFDALGQSGPPQSNFLGIAFRVVDERTHDAIYFRPFNFRADDPDRRLHAVQYISHPSYHWFDLRQNQPGCYEQPIIAAPDGDTWFHARIVIDWPTVQVFVNGSTKPSLVVEELSDRADGGIALWVGPGQGGYIANLTIIPAT
jgi:hypothetical protein